MIIKNKKEIATTKLRIQALTIAEAGIKRILPSNLIKEALKFNPKTEILKIKSLKKTQPGIFNLSKKRVFVIGGGKAVGLMAESLEKILGNKIKKGIVISDFLNYKTKRIKIIKGGHPIPNQKGLEGIKKMLALKKKYSINKNDFVFCLISGGGSSLMTCPASSEITLKNLQTTTELLINSGAKIEEINIIRKKLSKIKGGKLGGYFAPAPVVSLIISDVIGDDFKTIASGPTSPDPSTFKEAYNILKKYKLLSKIPKKVLNFLEKRIREKNEEDIKKLSNCYNCLIGNNQLALTAMAKKAKELGLSPFIITNQEQRNPRIAAQSISKGIIKGKFSQYNVFLLGGEFLLSIPKNHGKGGRNQHFAASLISAMKNYHRQWTAVSIASDGRDFLKNIAGAIVDNNSVKKAKEKRIKIEEYLKKYDSYNLLKKIGNSLIITGPTKTNVADLVVLIVKDN